MQCGGVWWSVQCGGCNVVGGGWFRLLSVAGAVSSHTCRDGRSAHPTHPTLPYHCTSLQLPVRGATGATSPGGPPSAEGTDAAAAANARAAEKRVLRLGAGTLYGLCNLDVP